MESKPICPVKLTIDAYTSDFYQPYSFMEELEMLSRNGYAIKYNPECSIIELFKKSFYLQFEASKDKKSIDIRGLHLI